MLLPVLSLVVHKIFELQYCWCSGTVDLATQTIVDHYMATQNTVSAMVLLAIT
jgi:hypothetical protein